MLPISCSTFAHSPALLASFINTTAGWVNLLLMSSCGPVKIPVGAWCVKALIFIVAVLIAIQRDRSAIPRDRM